MRKRRSRPPKGRQDFGTFGVGTFVNGNDNCFISAVEQGVIEVSDKVEALQRFWRSR